jgi:hypothetical protein
MFWVSLRHEVNMPLIRITNVTQTCGLVDPRGGEVAKLFQGTSPELVLMRDIIERVAPQLKRLMELGIISSYEVTDDPSMNHGAESASHEDINNILGTPGGAAIADNSYWVGTFGVGAQYETLGSAILAFESSPAQVGYVIPSATSVIDFGSVSVESTKRLQVGGFFDGQQALIRFEPGSGVWTYNAESLVLRNCIVESGQSNTTGYIKTDNADFVIELVGSTLLSWSSQALVQTTAVVTLNMTHDSRIQKIDIPGEGKVGFTVIDAEDVIATLDRSAIDTDSIVSATTPWDTLRFSADSTVPFNLGFASGPELTTEARYVKYYTSTSNPTNLDDIDRFFQIGCHWYNKTTDRMFYCADNRSGIAVWKPYIKVFSGSGSPDTVVSGFFGDDYYDTVGLQWYKCISDPSGNGWAAV